MAKTSNKLVNPNAREAMNRFKMEAANDLDVPVTSNVVGSFLRKFSYELVIDLY